MLRIIKKTVVLGARKPLQFSVNVAGGCRKLVGMGVIIPAINNQFASATITPSARQAEQVNERIDQRVLPPGVHPVLGASYSLFDGTNNYSLESADGINLFLNEKEINSPERIFCVCRTLSNPPFTRTYFYLEDDLSFDTTRKGVFNGSTQDYSEVNPFSLLLKKSDIFTFNKDTKSFVISRVLPIFAQFNGISVRMQVNNLRDNPLNDIYNQKIAMPFRSSAVTTEEAQVDMRKAFVCNLYEQSPLIKLNYDIVNHTKIDFIVDINTGNIINEDYLGEKCDLKVYLRYE